MQIKFGETIFVSPVYLGYYPADHPAANGDPHKPAPDRRETFVKLGTTTPGIDERSGLYRPIRASIVRWINPDTQKKRCFVVICEASFDDVSYTASEILEGGDIDDETLARAVFDKQNAAIQKVFQGYFSPKSLHGESMVTCWECGRKVKKSQCEWDIDGWYCGC